MMRHPDKNRVARDELRWERSVIDMQSDGISHVINDVPPNAVYRIMLHCRPGRGQTGGWTGFVTDRRQLPFDAAVLPGWRSMLVAVGA